jgi:histidinol-phosphatase (PHP family)
MTRPPDYHMHTPLCRHASGEPTEYASRALQLGFTEIGFSDHSPMRRDDFDNWRMRFDQLDDYVERVQCARRDHPSLSIRLALEVDYLPGQEDWIRELAARHPWDYFIGSVHYVSETWAIDDPSAISKWKGRDPFEVWSVYFDWLARAASSGLFQIIGHADLPKKFGFTPSEDCTPLFRNLVQCARRSGAAIELNTAGLRKQCREIYPAPGLLMLAQTEGVPITFGSDAHAIEEVGADFESAIKLARQCGYTHSVQYSARQSRSIPL